MNEYIIKQWNNVVSKDDLVYHLGDFALQSDKIIVSNLVQQLNGNIILILGNHDRWSKQKFRDCGFIDVYKKLEIGNYILTHRPIENLEDGKINLHGHRHGCNKDLNYKKYVDVSCEMVNYKPIWIDL